ncbi:MAG: glycoside hydrolase, partial [Actinomycetota bacterium]|nr:glycoside hydrolase [Actinomycetota bacterium]
MAHRLRPRRTGALAASRSRRPGARAAPLRHVAGRLAAGLLLLAAGVLLIVAGARPDPDRVSPKAGGFVNADRPGINNHNSPAVAVDPTRPSVVAVADRIDSPRFSCSVSISTSGGETWRPLALPLPADAPNCFWPDVAFTGDGRLLVLFTASGGRYNQPVGVWLQRFDGEQAAGPAVKVAGSEAFHAHMAVDGRRVLVAWVQTPPENAERPLGFAPGPNPVMLARSEDGGATFASPVRVSEPGLRVAHPTVVVGGGAGLRGPNAVAAGTVLVGALDYGDDVLDYEGTHEGQGGPPPAAHWRVLGWRSTDGGSTFGSTVVVADRLEVPQRVVIDLAPGPSFAADRARGLFYAAWDAGTGDGRDVFVTRSADDGRTWSPALRVGPRPRGQFLPALDVAPEGRLDVVFYDRSRDGRDVLADVRVGSSWDGGRTFVTRTVS